MIRLKRPLSARRNRVLGAGKRFPVDLVAKLVFPFDLAIGSNGTNDRRGFQRKLIQQRMKMSPVKPDTGEKRPFLVVRFSLFANFKQQISHDEVSRLRQSSPLKRVVATASL
jgi:hypothetical protein